MSSSRVMILTILPILVAFKDCILKGSPLIILRIADTRYTSFSLFASFSHKCSTSIPLLSINALLILVSVVPSRIEMTRSLGSMSAPSVFMILLRGLSAAVSMIVRLFVTQVVAWLPRGQQWLETLHQTLHLRGIVLPVTSLVLNQTTQLSFYA